MKDLVELDKLFLTSWPNGDLIPVQTLGKHPTIKDGIYIKYPDGGTDTTTSDFLFDIPDEYTRTALVDELLEALGEQRHAPLIEPDDGMFSASRRRKARRDRVFSAINAITGDKP